MKKFLLPALSMLLLGSAANAEEVSVTCWENNSYWKTVQKVFDPVKHELEVSGDGFYTIKDFMSSGVDVKFSITTGRIYGGQSAMSWRFPAEVWESPLLMFYAPVTTSTDIPKSESYTPVKNPLTGKQYQCKAMPVDGLSYSSLGVITNIPKKETVFPLEIVRGVSVAQYLGADDAGKHYKIWLGLSVKGAEVGDEDDDDFVVMGNFNSYAIFDMLLANDPVNVSYLDAYGGKWMQDTESVIGLLDDRTTSVTNFLNSGKTITLTTTGKSVGEGKSGVVFGSGFDSADDAGSYQALDGATANLLTAAGQAVSGPVMVRPAGCYAEQLEQLSWNKARYKVYLDTKIGDATGYTVFEITGTPLEQGSVYEMTLSMMNKSYGWDVVGECESAVNVIDDKNFVVYNFMNTGFNVPFALSDPIDGDPVWDSFAASQRLDLPDDYSKWYEERDENDKLVVSKIYKSIVIPEYPELILDGSYLNKSNESVAVKNLRIDVEPNDPNNGFYGMDDVFTYKDGDSVRKEYSVSFADSANKVYKLTWSKAKDLSGIADIVVDGLSPVEWYNLQGVRVNGENLAPGIYIKRQGSKAVKVLVK